MHRRDAQYFEPVAFDVVAHDGYKRMKNTVSIDDFYLELGSSKRTQELEFALQSFAKRNEYSALYYDKFRDSASEGKLAFERIDSSGNLRNHFEIYATAFIANAHAVVDSFPYVVFLCLQPLRFIHSKTLHEKKITANSSNWTDIFHTSLLHTYPGEERLAMLFGSLMNDNDFLLLRKMSNNHKHKFLSRIINDRKELKYEIINFDTDEISHINVEEFFTRIHNSLLPRLFNLYNELAKTANKFK